VCKHGNYKEVYVLVSNHNPIKVDYCIAYEIEKMNQCGIKTVGSCCVHGDHEAVALIEKESFDLAKKHGYIPTKYFYIDGEESMLYEIKLKRGE
jgi:NADPH-dependent 7-cyano-7-deazaguanine reductase QueF-like protein